VMPPWKSWYDFLTSEMSHSRFQKSHNFQKGDRSDRGRLYISRVPPTRSSSRPPSEPDRIWKIPITESNHPSVNLILSRCDGPMRRCWFWIPSIDNASLSRVHFTCLLLQRDTQSFLLLILDHMRENQRLLHDCLRARSRW
jgi:hypothetical protein